MAEKVRVAYSADSLPLLTFGVSVGSIIPVAPGRMRNIWYPQNKAQYMTTPQLKEAVEQGVVVEREYTFGIEPKESPNQVGDGAEDRVDVQLKLLAVKESSFRMGENTELIHDSHLVLRN